MVIKKTLPRNAPGTTEQIITQFANIHLDSAIADVGHGEGYLLNILFNMGYKNLCGFERPEMMETRDLADYAEIPWDEHAIDLNDQTQRKSVFSKGGMKFDVIICSEVLEHVYAPFECIEDFCNSLTIGGQLILTFPNAFSIWAQTRRHYRGSSRWFELDDEYPPEVRKSFEELTFHINPIDPICVAGFIQRKFNGLIKLVALDGNNFYKDHLLYESGWVDDPKEGDYWEQLYSTVPKKEQDKWLTASLEKLDKSKNSEVVFFADCILMRFEKVT
ncbi:MAG: class I SAM-dependent methyltransferase [Candidatus Thorarchaeota archaeon]|jgi:SAM-dependent methyltransferase